MKVPSWRTIAWSLGAVLWFTAAVAGMGALMNYSSRPGEPADAPNRWPATSRLVRDEHRPTLVMLAHPRCDCTQASISELAELMARTPQKPRAYIVFIKPGGTSTDWERTALWASAKAISGVSVVRDDDGVEAQHFQARTSGQILLYDAEGALIYAGGTTAARGKTGENAGRDAILAALANPRTRERSEPVFGCSLFGPADEQPVEVHSPDSHVRKSQP